MISFTNPSPRRYIFQLVAAASISSTQRKTATMENWRQSLRLREREPHCSCRPTGHCMLPFHTKGNAERGDIDLQLSRYGRRFAEPPTADGVNSVGDH